MTAIGFALLLTISDSKVSVLVSIQIKVAITHIFLTNYNYVVLNRINVM